MGGKECTTAAWVIIWRDLQIDGIGGWRGTQGAKRTEEDISRECRDGMAKTRGKVWAL